MLLPSLLPILLTPHRPAPTNPRPPPTNVNAEVQDQLEDVDEEVAVRSPRTPRTPGHPHPLRAARCPLPPPLCVSAPQGEDRSRPNPLPAQDGDILWWACPNIFLTVYDKVPAAPTQPAPTPPWPSTVLPPA